MTNEQFIQRLIKGGKTREYAEAKLKELQAEARYILKGK